MLNWIWLALILGSVVYGGLTGHMQAVSDAVFEGVRGAVDTVFKLVGVMVFFLGLTRVAFDGGLRDAFARAATVVAGRPHRRQTIATRHAGRRGPPAG